MKMFAKFKVIEKNKLFWSWSTFLTNHRSLRVLIIKIVNLNVVHISQTVYRILAFHHKTQIDSQQLCQLVYSFCLISDEILDSFTIDIQSFQVYYRCVN